jgi:hypothetical protein
MFSVYFKCYYRPGTNIPVAFSSGYTGKKFKVVASANGLNIDRIFIPAKSIIHYDGYYQGDIIPGTEECRFRAGNSDYCLTMYLILDNVAEMQAKHYNDIFITKIKSSDLYLRA